MALSLRLPARNFAVSTRPATVIAPPYAPTSQQFRSFSQVPQRWAYRSQNFTPRTVSAPSMKTRAKEALQGNLPNDIGLLPGTFVRPLWRDMPSLFEYPRDRWMMEWTSMKSFFQNYVRWVTVDSFQPQCCALFDWTGAQAWDN